MVSSAPGLLVAHPISDRTMSLPSGGYEGAEHLGFPGEDETQLLCISLLLGLFTDTGLAN